ncbi:FAD binding domain-containing protein [Streptomyces yerevanensis]|uniref:FAD binding domain-containing protein n=1 Tax=Streptomyces yerevanensis TaxID=66378 RepID=UPI000524B278|nr:FAD binding domain-containing protein [Streptomyces yerevanensis]
MYPFSYTKVSDTREAVNAGRDGGRYIAGGLPLREVRVTERGGLRIGALVSMAEAAVHPKVRTLFPVISQALELSASAQLRNMATIGGNIMQRTRCTYFRDVSADCNKRDPGSGCAALEGVNRTHAILGTSDDCVATHPSDVAVAFAALEARVQLLGPDGERHAPFADFLLRPGSTPNREQALRQGELITAVEIPALPRPLKSGYLKVRDRQSYEFALTSAAVALHVRGEVIRDAYVAAGGVGTVPWKLPAVEEALVGERPSDRLWAEAAGRAADGARPLQHNRFKVELLQRTVERQLRTVGDSK